ncbi:MAG: baseplate J/gp47 family protein [Lachnospiraceae bacterium]|nr:baseplate J/gp47 family protein [Lachnospiraceae bacterium]
MLRIEEVKPKSYEERINEALSEIPLYSSEWTNYNPSDPGITVMEYLTAFTSAQANTIPVVPKDAVRRLFLLAGLRPEKAKCSRVLIKAEGLKEPVNIPQNARFALGGMIFETKGSVLAGGEVKGIYTKSGDSFKDITFLARADVPVGGAVFGEEPAVGDALYIVTDSLPEEDKELILYAGLQDTYGRNPAPERAVNLFAEIRWEVYTENGFEEVKTRDFTGCFLANGEIRLRMPAGVSECDEAPVKGYCVRGVLTRADYDIPPRLISLESFLFEVWQKDTKAAAMIFTRSGKITVKHPLAGDEYILVFAKEEKGSSYRRYELSFEPDDEGRFVKYTQGTLNPEGKQCSFTLEFTGRKKPDFDLKDPVRVVMYSKDVMQQYEIGKVLGFDNQEFELPLKHLVTDSFSLIARRMGSDGAYIYDFVRPEKKDEGALYYHLLEDDGRIIIEDAGNYIGADLFVASAAVTEGEKGNVRANSKFMPASKLPEAKWFNPGPGTGGAYRELMKDLGVRFRRDIEKAYTAVTASDYERIVLETPGLCLRKAHAVIDEAENLVTVAVLPGTEGVKPELSKIYREEIARRLEERRLLTTRINIVSPRYVDVHVRGTVYVKRHYSDPHTTIVNEIKKIIDDVHSERGFGEPLRFRQVFAAIEALECVSYVYDLSIMPDEHSLAEYRDSDIYPEADVLCLAGDIQIETVTGD